MFFKANYEKFKKSEQQLGNNNKAMLGCQFYLLNAEGNILSECNYKSDVYFPMASTKKVAIALAVLRDVFQKKTLALNTQIAISNADFSPGRPTNSLDRYFFMPWEITDTKTIDELITYMLTESDNSSTDILLNLVGGVDTVNDLMKTLKLPEHNLSWSSTTLLSNYFNTPTTKTFTNIWNVACELATAFSLRPTEENMVHTQSDACTPQMMANLLKCMIQEMANPESWVGQAAKVIFAKMEKCLTGDTAIKAGVQAFWQNTQAFGSKQGGLGGIKNDSAFLHLKNGKWVILSIHTCLSDLSLDKRDIIVRELAKDILESYGEFFQDLVVDTSFNPVPTII